MRVSEAVAIERALATLPPAAVDPCLNLGSSTRAFRQEEPPAKRATLFGPTPEYGVYQPHIHQKVIAPLEDRGVRVLHADIKDGDGIDLVGDVFDSAFRERVRAVAPRLVLCSNMLEHLTDRDGFIDFCRDVVVPGGYVLVTVPRSYPYHADPIDTGYRPTPDELLALFPGWTQVWRELVVDSSYANELAAMPAIAWPRFVMTTLIRFPMLLATDRRRFRSRYHRFLWLFRKYSVSCILVRKPAAR